jgi:integrase
MSHHEREYYRLDKIRCLNRGERNQLRKVLLKRFLEGGARKDPLALKEWFLIEFGMCSGFRVSEICMVRIADLTLDSKRPFVLVKNGKGGKSRKVEIDWEFRETCKEFLKVKSEMGEPCNTDSPLFYSERSKAEYSPRALEYMFKRCLKIARVSGAYSIHGLRHTYAVALYKATKFNIRYVQKQLGHSSLRVTEIYLQTLLSELQEPLKKLY